MQACENAATILIAVPLCSLILAARYMVGFTQKQTVAWSAHGQHNIVWQQFVREAGYGRLVTGILGLVILLIPFRRNKRWAWFALLTILILYFAPVFVLPNLFPLHGWRGHFFDWLTEPGFVREAFVTNLLCPGMMALDLGLSFWEVFKGPAQTSA